jgi:hypothetical protein
MSAYSAGKAKSTQKEIGPNLFFDMTYVEATVSFFNTSLKTTTDGGLAFAATDSSFSGLSTGLYAKVPFTFWKITLYPFAGFDYAWYFDYSLDKERVTSEPLARVRSVIGIQQKESSASNVAYSSAQDYDALWLKAGLGFDLLLGKRFFFRGEASYGFRLENQYEKDFARSQWVLPGPLAQGFTFTAAFGWKLGKVRKVEPLVFGQKTETKGTYPAAFEGNWNGTGNELFVFTGNRYTTNAIRGQHERGTFTYTSMGVSGFITFEREAGMYGTEWIKDAYEPVTVRYSYANNQLILYGDTEITLER